MKAATLLIQDHRTVKGLFRKFERSNDAREKQKLGEEIIEELSVHAMLEEALVYPALRQIDKRMNGAVLEALEEHHVAKLTLLELDKMKVDDERYDPKMKVLREAIEMHIEEEEKDLLPRLGQILSDEQDEALAQALVAMKEAAPDHPHPMAPDTPPGNMVSAVLAKVLDLGKDLARNLTNRAKAVGHRRVLARRASARGKAAKLLKAKNGKPKAPPVKRRPRDSATV